MDGTNGKVIHPFSDEYLSTSPVCVSADGRRVAVQRVGSDVLSGYDILDARTGTPLGRASVKTDRSIPVSPPFILTRDGTTLVIVSYAEKKVHAFELDKSGGNPK